MNKICTSEEQSKKLIELGIDISTADMAYWKRSYRPNDYAIMARHTKELQEGFDAKGIEYVPSWSLSALLELIPNYVINKVDDKIYANLYYGLKSSHDNLVDVAFEMICQLKENKKI